MAELFAESTDGQTAEAARPDVSAEQIRLLFTGVGPGGAITMVAILYVGGGLWDVIDHGHILIWALMSVLVVVWRLFLGWLYQRRQPAAAAALKWAKLHAATAAVTGLLWGYSCVAFFVPESPQHQIFLVTAATFLTFGSAINLSGYPPSFYLGISACMLPLAYSFFAQGDGRSMAIGAGVLFFVAATSGVARRLNREREAALRLRIENETLQYRSALVQAQKMEAVGHLTSGIAHDFNNLLTVIRGNLQLIFEEIRERLPGGTAKLAEHALSAARDGTDLVDHLLSFSREQSLRPGDLDVAELLERLDVLLGRTLASEISLTARAREAGLAVHADPVRLESAILNLALNARDAMPEGGRLSIEIGRRRLEPGSASVYAEIPPGDYIEIKVADTGIGIPAGQLDQVTEPFFTTKEVGQGSGLGLSMVYGFARQSGGGLMIDSEVGRGTEISLLLPPGQAATASDVAAADSDIALGGGETILVVEDEGRVREFAVNCLRGLGYRVLEADNAAAALACLRDDGVDLLFTDLVMPGGMNGRALAAEALRTHPRVRVLLATGHGAATGAEDDALPPPLRKPYSREQLAAGVRQALDAPARPTA